MKTIIPILILSLFTGMAFAQTNKEQLALNVSKAEEQNLARLKEYIWKRNSNVFLDNQLKLTTITEFSFDKDGKVVTNVVDAKTTVKQQPGLRGKAQKDAMDEKADYIQKALALTVSYNFMSKGQLVDFFDKATVSEKDGMIEAIASNVLVQGDKLFVRIDPKTNLFIYKEFTSLLGKDVIDGKLFFDKFNNGTVHGTTTTVNMPVQKMRIEGTNQDYTIRVN